MPPTFWIKRPAERESEAILYTPSDIVSTDAQLGQVLIEYLLGTSYHHQGLEIKKGNSAFRLVEEGELRKAIKQYLNETVIIDRIINEGEG